MNFREFTQTFKDVDIVTNPMLQSFSDNVPYMQRQVSERTKKGWLTQLKKGMYVINSSHKDTISLMKIGNYLVQPSYISNESALSYRGIIPEGVFDITSITTKNTKRFENTLGTFVYKHIQSKCFTGFIKENNILIAKPEKALVDFLYFQSAYIKKVDDVVDQFRFQNLDELDFQLMMQYALLYTHKKLQNIVLFLQNYHDGYSSL